MADTLSGSSASGAHPPSMTDRSVARARNGDLVVFAANGFLAATWLSRLPDIKSMMGISPGGLGILLLALSIGALIGLTVAGRLLQRTAAARVVGIGSALTLSAVVFAAIGVTVGWAFPVVAAGLAVVGFGLGLWDVSQNLEGTVIEQALGRSIMPWFHAAFSGGTVIGALVAVLLIHLDVPLLVHVAGMSVLCAMAIAWGLRRFLPSAIVAGHEDSESPVDADHRSPWTEPRTLLIGVMVLAAAFTEGSANDWLPIAFVDGHDVTTAMGVVALTIFLAFMTAGRILGTHALDRYGRVPVLRLLFACALIGSLLVVFGSTPIAYVGAAIWGLGASLGFPVGMSAAADDPRRAAVRLSVVSTIGYGAFLAGPPLVGFLGDQVGVLRALTVVGLVSALALLVVPAARPLAASGSAEAG